MSNEITARRATIESYRDSEGMSAIASIDQAAGMSGCAMAIRLVNCGPVHGVFWLAKTGDEGDKNDYILMLPFPRWEQDARDAGWKLLKKLSTEGHK